MTDMSTRPPYIRKPHKGGYLATPELITSIDADGMTNQTSPADCDPDCNSGIQS